MAGKTVRVGVLALQGAVEPHLRHLEKVGAVGVSVRKPQHLTGLSGIILPGGESTTMLHLLQINSLWDPLQDFIALKPVWGVCAGAILLAKGVTHPAQASFQSLDIDVSRNAFGRQRESFTASVDPTPLWSGAPLEGVFIRAPRITRLGADVKVLLEYQGEAVFVEQGKRMASTFHPELTESLAVHHYFITKCESEDAPWMIASPSTSASLSVN